MEITDHCFGLGSFTGAQQTGKNENEVILKFQEVQTKSLTWLSEEAGKIMRDNKQISRKAGFNQDDNDVFLSFNPLKK